MKIIIHKGLFEAPFENEKIKGMLLPDIYFKEEYGRLCELIEHGDAVIFVYRSSLGEIKHQFIKRPLPKEIDPEGKYFDITTPYGYGGPIVACSEENKKALIEEYEKEFSDYCRRERIISEFIRFHPVIANHRDFEKYYDVIYVRDTVVTKLDGVSDPMQANFSKSCRRDIRTALRTGVEIEVVDKPDDLGSFLEIYHHTMDRNHAKQFYYFGEEYFNYMTKHLKDNLLLVNVIYEGKVVSQGLYFYCDKIMQVHLSGSLQEYLWLSPAYLLQYAAINWANEHGIRYVHHGGGVTNSEDDSLFFFKKRFSKDDPIPFYIGERIHDEEAYHHFVELTGKSNSQFFPKYRE